MFKIGSIYANSARTLSLFFLVLLFNSCSQQKGNLLDSPQRIIISGKVLNHEQEWIRISLNRLGFSQQEIEVPLDTLGCFSASFESYTPTDVWITCKANFLIPIHPADSIYIELDGSQKEKVGLLQSVKLSGDQIKPKQEAIVFQQLFYSDLDNSNDTVNQRYKELDVEQFIEYLKETEQNFKTLQECFLERDNPDLEVLMWVSEFLKSQVYNRIFFYPFFHKTLNNLPYEHDFLAMPAALFAPITKRETVLHESMLISGEALTSYFRHYIGVYKQTNNLYRGNLKDDVPQNTLDSLTVYGLLNSTNDDLFKQVVLTTLFSQKISVEFDIEFFERFQSLLEQTLKEPFLREPLWALYQEEKQKLDAVNKSYGQSFNGEVDELGKQLLDSIISINKGKIIYLDYWATWCGPCRAEMPKTKLLMEKMKGENVVVAFFCLHSEMEDWQKAREEIEHGGQHYFLPKKQSLDFVKSYGINGVPNYMLIDAQGNIVDQGVHLKPDIVPERINELLQN